MTDQINLTFANLDALAHALRGRSDLVPWERFCKEWPADFAEEFRHRARFVIANHAVSEPEAGEVTWRVKDGQRVRAPATADKLREAAGLLNDCIWLDTDTGDYRVEHDGSVEKARVILAALNEQPL